MIKEDITDTKQINLQVIRASKDFTVAHRDPFYIANSLYYPETLGILHSQETLANIGQTLPPSLHRLESDVNTYFSKVVRLSKMRSLYGSGETGGTPTANKFAPAQFSPSVRIVHFHLRAGIDV